MEACNKSIAELSIKVFRYGRSCLPILKFSYDSLSDDTVKKCFLYCCIFPEDHDIEKNELIELWIGEGFLDKFDDIHDARNEENLLWEV